MKNFVLIVIIAFGLACSSFVALAQSPQDKVDFGPKETLSVVSNDKTHTFTIEARCGLQAGCADHPARFR